MKNNIAILFIMLLSVAVLTGCDSAESSAGGQQGASYTEDTKENQDMTGTEMVRIVPSEEEQSEVEDESEGTKESMESEETSEPEETMEPTDDPVIDDLEPEAISSEEDVLHETVVNETVWVKTNANVRSGPGTNYSIVGSLDYSESVTRVAVTDNGWSKINYSGGMAYISSSLVQTTEISVPDVTVVTGTAPAPVTVAEEPAGTLCVGEAKVIFDEVNARRAEAGLESLEWSDELARAADIRVGEIKNTFSHTRPDGTSWQTVSSLAAAENIVMGTRLNGSEMMDLWMSSEGHKANILNPSLKIIGVATRRTEEGDAGVQLFGW